MKRKEVMAREARLRIKWLKMLRRVWQSELSQPDALRVLDDAASRADEAPIESDDGDERSPANVRALSVVSREPTRTLLMLNGGALLGVQPLVLRDALAAAADVEPSSVSMHVDASKTYALATFASVEAARRAYERVPRDEPLAALGGRVAQIEYTPLTRLRAQNGRIAASIRAAKEGGFAVVDVPGMYLLHDFVDEREERELLDELARQPWIALQHRRVQHYGYAFDYATNGVDVTRPIGGAQPAFFDRPLDRVAQLVPRLVPFRCDQLTVNELRPLRCSAALLLTVALTDTIQTVKFLRTSTRSAVFAALCLFDAVVDAVAQHHMFDDTIISLSLGSHTGNCVSLQTSSTDTQTHQ